MGRVSVSSLNINAQAVSDMMCIVLQSALSASLPSHFYPGTDMLHD